MTLTRSALVSILTNAQNNYDSGLSLWKGTTFNTATEVFNSDGSKPWVNQTTLIDTNLAIDPAYRTTDEVYQASFPAIDDNNLDDYLQDTFWITTFGTNPKRVKPTPKQLKNQGAVWVVNFIHRVDN
jgi:hypothetical protein